MINHRDLQASDYTRMNLPADLWERTLADVPESIREPIALYCRCDPDAARVDEMVRDGLGWVLWGDPGVGKSTTAAVIAKEVRSHAHSVFFVTVHDLREMIRSKATFDDNTVTVMERAKDVELLVIDGVRQMDPRDPVFNGYELERLIESRLAWKKATVLTTRLNPNEQKLHFPDAMEAMRVRCAVLEVKGPNRREGVQAELQARLGVKKKGA